MARVFVSHSAMDRDAAARLLHWLGTNGHESAFLDFDQRAGIAPGADWERTLYREIAKSDVLALIHTKHSVESKWCFAEFTHARALGKPVIPLIEDPPADRLVSPGIQHLDLRADREAALDALSRELERISIHARGQFHWDGSRPPFPGLLAFDERDAAIYFGRDDEVRRLIERLNARRVLGGPKLVLLLGASGSGKSSLLRAGIVRRLQLDRRNWVPIPPFRPQARPISELAQAIVQVLPGASWREIQSSLENAPPKDALYALAADLRAASGSNSAHILVPIDQGEEMLSGASTEEPSPFWDLLNTLLLEDLPFIVVMCLRSDYLPALQNNARIAAPFEEFRLDPLPLPRIREVIEGPARVANLTVAPGLVEAAIRDAATEHALPLLAFALRELYDRVGRTMSLEAYQALGDPALGLTPLENAVRQRAEQVLRDAAPSAKQLQALKHTLVHFLVRVNVEGDYTRQPATLSEIPEPARPILHQLTQARLMVMREENESIIVEVAHEALFTAWPALKNWLTQEREFLIWRAELERAHARWRDQHGPQRRSALLVARALGQSIHWQRGKNRVGWRLRRFVEFSRSWPRFWTALTLAAAFPLILNLSFGALDNVLAISWSSYRDASYELHSANDHFPILIGYASAFVAYGGIISWLFLKSAMPSSMGRFPALRATFIAATAAVVLLTLALLFPTVVAPGVDVMPWPGG